MRPKSDLSIAKKVLFSAVVFILFLVTIEFTARAYHFLKYKDPEVFFYGKKYLQNIFARGFQGGGVDDTYERNDKASREADEIFEKRAERTAPPPVEGPTKQNMFSYFAYINTYGLRNREVALIKDPQTVRIIAIGGSFVACYGVDDASTWPVLVEKRLAGYPGKYEMINGGIGGATIDQLLVSLIDKAIKFDPDYVLVISAINNNRLMRYQNTYPLLWKINKFIYGISQGYAMFLEKLSLWRYKENNHHLYNFNVRVKKSDFDECVRKYEKRLAQICAVCREHNCRPILGLQPIFIPWGLRDLTDVLDESKVDKCGKKLERQGYLSYYEMDYYTQGRFNLAMKRFAEKEGVALFDGVSIFPADKYPYFMDDIHLTNKGTSLFANALCDFLISQGIVKTTKE